MCGHTSRSKYCEETLAFRLFSLRLQPRLPILERVADRLRLALVRQFRHFCCEPFDLGVLNRQRHKRNSLSTSYQPGIIPVCPCRAVACSRSKAADPTKSPN